MWIKNSRCLWTVSLVKIWTIELFYWFLIFLNDFKIDIGRNGRTAKLFRLKKLVKYILERDEINTSHFHSCNKFSNANESIPNNLNIYLIFFYCGTPPDMDNILNYSVYCAQAIPDTFTSFNLKTFNPIG